MSEQPPVQKPEQPSNPPSSQPAAGTPPTQPMPAVGSPAVPPAGSSVPPVGPSVPPVGPPAPPVGPTSGHEPKPSMWRRVTSTNGGRWGLALAAGALALLLILMIGIAGIAVLRNHDRVNFMSQRQDGYSRGQDDQGNGGGLNNGPGYGNGQGPRAKKNGNGQQYMPGMPGGRGQGLGGLGSLLGGTALHGQVTGTINGSVQTLLFQRGEVTAVSDTSITLKSSDGFVGTYGRNATTVSRGSAPVKGGQALVLARASDKVAITIMATPDLTGVAPSS